MIFRSSRIAKGSRSAPRRSCKSPYPAGLYESLLDLVCFPLTGRRLKVLVVDDDPKAGNDRRPHPGPGSTVLRAYGGREAIDAAGRELPDLIVLDLMMPT